MIAEDSEVIEERYITSKSAGENGSQGPKNICESLHLRQSEILKGWTLFEEQKYQQNSFTLVLPTAFSSPPFTLYYSYSALSPTAVPCG